MGCDYEFTIFYLRKIRNVTNVMMKACEIAPLGFPKRVGIVQPRI